MELDTKKIEAAIEAQNGDALLEGLGIEDCNVVTLTLGDVATALLDDPCTDEQGNPTWTIENVKRVLDRGRTDERYEEEILIANCKHHWLDVCNRVSHTILADLQNEARSK